MNNTTIRSAFQYSINRLRLHFDQNESNSLARIVFEHFFKLDRVRLATQCNEPFLPSNHYELEEMLRKLIQGVPVQYLTSTTNFYGLDFFVDERVLIPRPETEELVQWIINDATVEKNTQKWRMLDIGTGSGCIAVTLSANLKQAAIEACDVSAMALDVATLNARNNNAHVKFFQHNILAEELPENRYDVIVSNPPYVMEKEKVFMNKNILEHEPHNALFVSNERPLVFYQAIASKACKALKPSGTLYLEINENLANETINCLQKAGFVNIELKQDMKGKYRMVKAGKSL